VPLELRTDLDERRAQLWCVVPQPIKPRNLFGCCLVCRGTDPRANGVAPDELRFRVASTFVAWQTQLSDLDQLIVD
jgi:hypothetical protein